MAIARIINEDGGTSSGGGGQGDSLTIENLSNQITGSNINFATSNVFVSQSLQVYYNGLLQVRGEDYTEDNDREGLTWALAPELDSKVLVIYTIDNS